MGPRVQLPPEIQLAQRLAGNEQVTRDRAVRKLRKYIVARTQRAEGGRGSASWGRRGPGGLRGLAGRGTRGVRGPGPFQRRGSSTWSGRARGACVGASTRLPPTLAALKVLGAHFVLR